MFSGLEAKGFTSEFSRTGHGANMWLGFLPLKRHSDTVFWSSLVFSIKFSIYRKFIPDLRSAHTIILVFHILVENLGRETKIAEHVSDQSMFYFYEAVSFFPVQFSLFLANRLQVSFHDNPYKLLGNYDIEHCHYKNEGLAAAVLRGWNSTLEKNGTISDWSSKFLQMAYLFSVLLVLSPLC